MKTFPCYCLLIILLIALVAYLKPPKAADKPPVSTDALEEMLLLQALKTHHLDSLINLYEKRDSLQHETIKQLEHENNRLHELEKGPLPTVYLAAPADSILSEFLRRTS